MTKRNIDITLSLLVVLLLAVACSDDFEQSQQQYPLYIMPGMAETTDYNPADQPTYTPAWQQSALTRTSTEFTVGGKTYVPFDNNFYPQPINPAVNTIGIFLATEADPSLSDISGTFTYRNDPGKQNTWESTVNVEEKDYWVYGVMPASLTGVNMTLARRDATTELLSPTWADGAKITLNNFPTLTAADVCVVVGVQKGDPLKSYAAQDDITTLGSDGSLDPENQIHQGSFSYSGSKTKNYIYILLDHIYSNINFKLMVERNYALMRKIELTQVRMKSSLPALSDITIVMQNDPLNPIQSITPNDHANTPDNEKPWIELFPTTSVTTMQVEPERTAAELEAENLAEQPTTSIPGYFAPGSTSQTFYCEFTYNVLDSNGNLIRKDCVAVNKWTLNSNTVLAGKSIPVLVTIRPTYLYQLSEPDLDNPTFEIQ